MATTLSTPFTRFETVGFRESIIYSKKPMYKLEKIESAENPDARWNDDLLKDPHAVADKRKRVQDMFAAIAPSYDLNNRLHSLWMDQAWRRTAVKLAQLKSTDRVVDVACGTGDLSLAFVDGLVRIAGGKVFSGRDGRSGWSCGVDHIPLKVVGVDFTFQMLPIAASKTRRVHSYWADVLGLSDSWTSPILWTNGDAQSLPLPDQFADVVSIAFGIRNVQDPAKALSEFRRVLRPGGRLIILEFSLPTSPILRTLYNFYFRQILPRTATLISGDKTGAYKYLAREREHLHQPADDGRHDGHRRFHAD